MHTFWYAMFKYSVRILFFRFLLTLALLSVGVNSQNSDFIEALHRTEENYSY